MTHMEAQEKTASFETAACIVRRLRQAGYEAYLVGGCVRDLLLKKSPLDYDIVTSARPEEIQSIFFRTVPVGIRFGVILVIEDDHPYEVATFRTEDDYTDGRRPSRVAFSSAREDILRRDFTINGLLMDPDTREVIDYVNGRADIKRRVIQTVGDPQQRFSEDYLRMLRAVRFAAALNFRIAPQTFAAIRQHAHAIEYISAERIREELTRILTQGGARYGLELLNDTGLLSLALPEVDALRGVEQPPQFHPEGDVWEHTLRMLALMPAGADERLAWAVLMHDLGKASTRSEDESGVHFYGHVRKSEETAEAVIRRLRFSRDAMDTILELIRHHMVFMNVPQMRPSRLKRFLRMDNFDLHLELHRLDCLGSHGFLDNYEFCRTKLTEFAKDDLRPPRLISGDDLIEMVLKPGPLFSKILRSVEDAQLNGEITTSQNAKKWVSERYLYTAHGNS
jgi:poly(A) polymerase